MIEKRYKKTYCSAVCSLLFLWHVHKTSQRTGE